MTGKDDLMMKAAYKGGIVFFMILAMIMVGMDTAEAGEVRIPEPLSNTVKLDSDDENQKGIELQPGVSAEDITAQLGMITGEGHGLTPEYLAKTPTRIQAAVMFLRLKGLEQTALNYQGKDNFSDADEAPWAASILAYLKAHPELGFQGIGNNKFNPNGKITAQAYYKILLETLGYTYDEDFKWDNTMEFAESLGLGRVAEAYEFTVSDLAVATVEVLSVKMKGSEKTLLQALMEQNVIDDELLSSITQP